MPIPRTLPPQPMRPIKVWRCVAFVVSLPAIVLSLSVPGLAQSLTDVYLRLDKAAPGFKSMTADIQRVVHTAVINDDSKETGTIKLKRQKPHDTRMLIEFTAPDPKSVALADDIVSVYYPKIKTVQIYNVGDKRSLIDQFLLLGFGATSAELQEAYNIAWAGTENIAGQGTSHIQLVPKSKEVLVRLKQADLWLSDANGLPVQQKFVTSSTGDYMVVTYANLKHNPPLTDGALKLNYPKGVQVEHPQL
jgi:outer membrane lipoprotein-sorting protein